MLLLFFIYEYYLGFGLKLHSLFVSHISSFSLFFNTTFLILIFCV